MKNENKIINNNNNLYAQKEYHLNHISNKGNSNPQSYDKKASKALSNFVSNISKKGKICLILLLL